MTAQIHFKLWFYLISLPLHLPHTAHTSHLHAVQLAPLPFYALLKQLGLTSEGSKSMPPTIPQRGGPSALKRGYAVVGGKTTVAGGKGGKGLGGKLGGKRHRYVFPTQTLK